MSEQLIAPPFLFRFAVPCVSTKKVWGDRGVTLEPKYQIPSFQTELTQSTPFSELRMAWKSDGLLFQVQVKGKKKELWCRESRLLESDGLTLWIDTRDTHNVHRASRFCHQFVFLPAGEGAKYQNPVAELMNIHRARDNPQQPNRGELKVHSTIKKDGYKMSGWIPATAITGYDTNEHKRLGFYYVIKDRELGWQSLALGSEYPFYTDPSLWGSMDLESNG